jgi:hypothetical protein
VCILAYPGVKLLATLMHFGWFNRFIHVLFI